MIAAVLAGLGECLGIRIPTVSGLFSIVREMGDVFSQWNWLKSSAVWIGWLLTAFVFLLGLRLVWVFRSGRNFSPLTLRRIQRFKAIRRGYWSLLLLFLLGLVSCLDFVLVGSEALAVKYEGKWSFPAFEPRGEEGTVKAGKDYGVVGDLAEAPVNWRERQEIYRKEEQGNRVIMPLLPYAPTGDTIAATSVPLTFQDEFLYQGGELYRGLACQVYDVTHPEHRRLQVTVREGVKQGDATGWSEDRVQIFTGRYEDGELVSSTVSWSGEGELEEFLNMETSEWRRVSFPPSLPVYQNSPRHWLGTTSQGYDTLAYLYGGLQVNFLAAILYIPCVYLIGVTVGLLMGYFGGWFDIVVQRLIEVFSNIPFLYVVMIASASVPLLWKERFGLGIIVFILVIFWWMGMTYYMRTSAMKEKARDYIAASRVIGASTPRIIFRHLLPNSVAIIVTLIPFSVSGIILALTSLDYLGFGLPERYASWGKLLRDGLENLTAPWLVTSAFVMLVLLLVLVTFVGEAIREAFDPKKYTYYR